MRYTCLNTAHGAIVKMFDSSMFDLSIIIYFFFVQLEIYYIKLFLSIALCLTKYKVICKIYNRHKRRCEQINFR